MRRTGSARRVFFGSTGAHRINGLSMCTPRAGNPPFPVPGGAAKYPIRELIAESPQAPANEAATQGARQCRQPPVFRKNRQSAFIWHAHGRPCISRPIPEHTIHAVSRHTRGPGEHLANPRPLHDEPRKIPNMQMQDGIPCKRRSPGPSAASSPVSAGFANAAGGPVSRRPRSAEQWRLVLHPFAELPLDLRRMVGTERLRQKRPEFLIPALPDHVAQHRHE